jgi:hypothetical protein
VTRVPAGTPVTETRGQSRVARWSIDYEDFVPDESLRHSGETRVSRNVILRYPNQELTVIVLTNRNDPQPYSNALASARIFLPGARQ